MQEKLLPNPYKKVGLGLGIFALISLITFHFYLEEQQLFIADAETTNWIFKDLFLIGLLLIAFAKEKDENPEYGSLRFKHLKDSLIFTAGFYIIDSISEMLFSSGNFEMKTGYEVLIFILIYYLASFNFRDQQKK